MLPLKGAKIVYLEKEAFYLIKKTTRQKSQESFICEFFLNELFLIASNKGAFSVSERAPSALILFLLEA